METIVIIDKESDRYRLSESGHGNREVQFAFINPENYHTVTPMCKCKDYFNDIFFTNITGNNVRIHGLEWTKNKDGGVLNLEHDRLSLTVRIKPPSPKVTPEEIDTVRALLVKFSAALSFAEPEITPCEDGFIVKYDSSWSKVPYLNSALFYLIRLGFTYDPNLDFIEQYSKAKIGKFISSNDASYFPSARQRLEDMLQSKIDARQKYEDYSVYNIHDSSGLIGYSDYKI